MKRMKPRRNVTANNIINENNTVVKFFYASAICTFMFQKDVCSRKNHETIYVYYFLSNEVYRHSTPKFITSFAHIDYIQQPSKSEVWPCLLKSTPLKYWKYAQTYPNSQTCRLLFDSRDSRLPCKLKCSIHQGLAPLFFSVGPW